MKRILAVLVVLSLGVILTGVPLEYTGLSETASHYLEGSLSDTGSRNVVAAILADYRLYDTLGEATVLFAAILGVTMLLGRSRHRTEERIRKIDQLYGGSYDGDVYHR